MRRKILLPLDGSAFAERAAPYAASVADRAGAEVTVALVHPSLPAVTESSRAEMVEWARKGEQAYLDEVATRLFTGTKARVGTSLLRGDPAQTLIAFAEKQEVDLVVMSTQGWGPASRLWLGSVADRMVRELTTPLLLIRPNGELTAPGAPSEALIHRVLLPLDRSRFSECALEGAAFLSELFCAEIVPLYVVEVPVEVDRPPLTLPFLEDKRTTLGLETEAATTYLKNIAAELRTRNVDVGDPLVVRGADVATTILDQVGKTNANAIAIATHGEKGVRRMVLGSVTDKVIRGADVPVLVCRPRS